MNEVTAKLSPLSIVGGLSKGAAALTAAGIGLVHAVEGVGYPRDMDVDMLRMLEGGLPQTFRIFLSDHGCFQGAETPDEAHRRLF